ncbi:nucleoside diphosphate kinase [Biscogniauxia mediterranea]|nr:nucleoside diphosphate kinase [Biscogniauxia mediterranea]
MDKTHNPSSGPRPNQHPPGDGRLPRRGLRHPALCIFLTTICILFFLFFLLPWQVHDRQAWNFPKSLTILSPLSTSSQPSLDQPVPGPVVVTTTPPSNSSSKMSASEQTFIAIKPDGVQRGLVGPIISRFESRGFKLAAIKLVTPGKAHLEQHYADLKDKPFFPGLVEYMNSGPICAMVWEGRDAVKTGRTLLGATNPLASAPGTIRGDYAIDVGRNVCHGSDSVENAKKEIALWFKEGEVVSWESAQAKWIYEKP